jgi:Family of unknown function (DUF6527)
MVTWLRSIWYRVIWLSRYRVIASVEAADEVPDALPALGAVLVGTTAEPKWIAFDCPCNDNHRVMVNLDLRRRPAWRMTSAAPLTLQPSIDALRGAKRCHYFLTKGRVRWVPNPTAR